MSKYLGVFEKIEEAIQASVKAQKELVCKYSTDDRARFIAAVKKSIMGRLEELCRLEFEETGYGRYEDKLQQNSGVALTQGVEAVPTEVIATSQGLTVEYHAPFGIVGCVTPVTNPMATISANSIHMIAAGNGAVFNPHPSATRTAHEVIHLINQTLQEEDGPVNLVTMAEKPTLETLDVIMAAREIRLLVGTGGPAMVKTLMQSGKRVIAAGPGNPPCIVDETADIKKAAAAIFNSASFNNNLLCIAEKELFVVEDVFDSFIHEMVGLGAYLMTEEEVRKVEKVGLEYHEGSGYAANKKWVGKYARDILAEAGIPVGGDPRLAIYEAKNEDPFVQTEQMMPILPIVKCKDFDQAVERALAAEHGNLHSAAIWTKNVDRSTRFGTLINTTIFVVNGGTMSAFGHGGSGTDSPTIATPTGDGVTSPATYTRRRRYCMADGQNYIL